MTHIGEKAQLIGGVFGELGQCFTRLYRIAGQDFSFAVSLLENSRQEPVPRKWSM